MSYADVDVLGAVESSSIAGGAQYDGKLHPSDADTEVSTADGLLSALDGSSDVIAIANDAVIDLTGENQIDLGSKTLVSYRGRNGQEGALIRTDSRGYYGTRPYTLFDSAGSPRVTGLRIRGARATGGFTRWDYDDNLAQAIRLRGPGGEVDNCELFGWTWNAVHLKGDGESTVTEAEVHHNHIHKSYQLGYGYGITIRRGFGEIHHNYFDETRHTIAGYGWWNSGFVVENNVFGPRHYSHTVDMHCLEENRATARVGDDPNDPDYDLRAGGEMRVRNNTFCMDQGVHGGGINAIAIRGVPWDGVWIENNRFAHSQRPPYNSGNDQEGFAWRQVNLNLSGWDPIPQDDEGYTRNWNDTDNQFGAPDTPWESGYGAPVNLVGGGGEEPEEDEDQEDEDQEDEEDEEDEEEEQDGRDVITVSGGGSTTYYEFEFSVDGDVEKSEEYGATINSYDQISGSTVSGRTTNEPDSFAYTGEIASFEADDGIEVRINGEPVDPDTLGEDEEDEEDEEEGEDVVTINGRGETVYYTFSVDGGVEKSNANDATINESDSIIGYSDFDTIVTGRTTNQSDSFVLEGEITSFSTSSTGGPAAISLGGESITPDEFGETVITIADRGATARYELEFSVNADIEKSEQYGATIDSTDQVNGTAVSGQTTDEPDSYVFSGALTEFRADEAVDVSFNGQSTGLWIESEEQELEEEEQDERDVITVSGGGSTTYYEFEFSVDGDVEKSEQYGATINSYDQISGSTVSGRTTNEPDSFAYTGEITSFEADDGIEVQINGESVDPDTLGEDEEEEEEQDDQDVITVAGGGSTTYYEFEFSISGDVEKSEQYGATINSYDQISGSTVSGRTTNEPDSFAYTGEIVSFEADEGIEVQINGEEVDPDTLGEDEEEEEDEEDVLTINGQGETVYYTFSVDGGVEKSNANDATINEFDSIIGYNDYDTIVTGRTTTQSDSFVLEGDITSFSTSSTGDPGDISIDGESVDPDEFGETVITIAGRGATARYELEFSVNADIEKSEQYGATINDYDQISGTTVTGRTTNAPDSYVFSGALTEFSADEVVDVSFNGESTGNWI
ncbi:hypothetical protein [Halalkalicoccus ordinarius]|uniref:hypothetical protein n=1 Tax=Halalkalicoccus ordinarius TaxID=3116651 RepID=UPI00300F63D1